MNGPLHTNTHELIQNTDKDILCRGKNESEEASLITQRIDKERKARDITVKFQCEN